MWRAACCAQTYWSVQGQVWAEAKADKTSDVGKWFSWGPESCEGVAPCDGSNVKVPGVGCAQGSWGSEGAFKGVRSALASFGSPEYSSYLSDAMANSWARSLGVDGFCTDCSGSYAAKPGQCPRGMLQQHGNSQLSLAKIIDKAREQQPQIAMGGEQ